jgi:spoIIIJ-associated protein
VSSVVEWVETTGKTVDEAKELALDQLGVDANEAEFELIEEPKSGLFGRTRGTARVRARVVPLAPPPKTERRRRGKKGSDRNDDAAPAATTATASSESAPAKAKDGGRSGGRDSGSRTSDGRDGGGRGGDSGRRRGNGDNGSGSSRASDTPRELMDADEQQKVLEEFLTGLATSFGLTAEATSTMEDNELTVNLTGSSLGLLVGPRLATLDAIQEVARNTLQRQAAGREYAKVIVDVEGIRQRRRDSLTAFVTDAAQQVRDEDVEVVFEVMSSVDRKQVHDVASELDGVVTASEGEDPRRRVVLRKA